MPKLILIDDELEFLRTAARQLDGYELAAYLDEKKDRIAIKLEQISNLYLAVAPDIVLCDSSLRGYHAWDVHSKLQEACSGNAALAERIIFIAWSPSAEERLIEVYRIKGIPLQKKPANNTEWERFRAFLLECTQRSS